MCQRGYTSLHLYQQYVEILYLLSNGIKFSANRAQLYSNFIGDTVLGKFSVDFLKFLPVHSVLALRLVLVVILLFPVKVIFVY